MDIRSTITSGIQDVSALLPLLGTEQCEVHVGSALEGGYLYAAAAPMSIFGSLGICLAGFKVFMASLVGKEYMGARTLDNAGFVSDGAHTSLIMLDRTSKNHYLAETRLKAMLDREHLDTENMKIAPDANCSSWNAQMIFTSLLFCSLGIVPYLHLNIRDHPSFSGPLRWVLPIIRVVGSFIVTATMQYATQRRIVDIVNGRLLFRAMDRNIASHNLASKLLEACGWSSDERTASCLHRLDRYLSDKPNGELDLEKGGRRESQLSTSTRTTTSSTSTSESELRDLQEYLQNLKTKYLNDGGHFLLVVCLFLLPCGIALSVFGYIGCFSLVNSASGLGPTIWLVLEVSLSLLRTAVWALDPTWDQDTRLTLSIQLSRVAPLVTCNKYAEELDTECVIPLVRDRDFLENVTAYAGLVKRFDDTRVSLYYTLTRKDSKERVLYITMHDYKERTSRVIVWPTTTPAPRDPIVSIASLEYDEEEGVVEAYMKKGIAIKTSRHVADNENVMQELKNHYQAILNGFKSRDGEISHTLDPKMLAIFITWGLDIDVRDQTAASQCFVVGYWTKIKNLYLRYGDQGDEAVGDKLSISSRAGRFPVTPTEDAATTSNLHEQCLESHVVVGPDERVPDSGGTIQLGAVSDSGTPNSTVNHAHGRDNVVEPVHSGNSDSSHDDIIYLDAGREQWDRRKMARKLRRWSEEYMQLITRETLEDGSWLQHLPIDKSETRRELEYMFLFEGAAMEMLLVEENVAMEKVLSETHQKVVVALAHRENLEEPSGETDKRLMRECVKFAESRLTKERDHTSKRLTVMWEAAQRRMEANELGSANSRLLREKMDILEDKLRKAWAVAIDADWDSNDPFETQQSDVSELDEILAIGKRDMEGRLKNAVKIQQAMRKKWEILQSRLEQERTMGSDIAKTPSEWSNRDPADESLQLSPFTQTIAFITNSKHAKYIEITRRMIDREGIHAVARALKRNANLEVLDLTNCSLTSDEASSIATAIKDDKPQLTSINLARDEDMRGFAGKIRTYQNRLAISRGCEVIFTRQPEDHVAQTIAYYESIRVTDDYRRGNPYLLFEYPGVSRCVIRFTPPNEGGMLLRLTHVTLVENHMIIQVNERRDSDHYHFPREDNFVEWERVLEPSELHAGQVNEVSILLAEGNPEVYWLSSFELLPSPVPVVQSDRREEQPAGT